MPRTSRPAATRRARPPGARRCRARPRAPRRSVGARDVPARTFVRECDGDGAGARAEIRDAAPRAPSTRSSTRCTNSSVSGRGTSTAGLTVEVERPEFAPAQKIGDGHAGRALPAGVGEACGDLGRHAVHPSRASSCAAGLAPAPGEQDFRVAARRWSVRRRPAVARCRTVRTWGSDDARVPPGIGIMPRMNRAQPLDAPVGLLPLPRPLMTGEVLDAAFRLFRAGILRCLPYSGLAVLVLELPTLYSTFRRLRVRGAEPAASANLTAQRLSDRAVPAQRPLLGVITLRLNALAQGMRPRFRRELAAALTALAGGACSPPHSHSVTPPAAVVLWPLLIVSLAGRGAGLRGGAGVVAGGAVRGRVARILVRRAHALSARSRRRCGSRVRRSWRMFGAILATVCMVMVFFVLSADHRRDDVAAVRPRRSVPDRDRRFDALPGGGRFRRAVRARGAHRGVPGSETARAGTPTRCAHDPLARAC